MSGSENRFGHEAEQAVLGAMMIERRAVVAALLRLDDSDFHAEAHRVLFGVIREMHDAGFAMDAVTVCEELRHRQLLDAVGGGGNIAAMIRQVTTCDHVDHYARIVRDASLDRQIKIAFKRAWEDQTEKSLRELVDLRLARDGNAGGRLFDMREDLPGMIDEILRRDIPVIKTGFNKLDALLGGIIAGEVVTVGARTSGGKTSFMLRVAVKMAQEDNEVLYITAEEKEREIVARLLPQATGVPSYKFRSRTWNEYDIERVRGEGVDRMSSLPMRLLSRGRIAMQDIRRAVLQSNCKVVFVDYLQRCRLPAGERESSQLYEFMADFKELCHDTGVIGFIGSQLDRERDMRANEAPKLRDFRGSSGIESESSICLLLWKPGAPDLNKPKAMDYIPPKAGCIRVQAIIAKARGGPADLAVDMDFQGDLLKFTEARLNGHAGEARDDIQTDAR